jgi:hypothetical protein
MSDYFNGRLVRCEANFRNPEDGYVLVDPDAITFKFKTPSGSTTIYQYGTNNQLVREATGVYYVNVVASEAGTWSYRFEASGGFVGNNEDSFTVGAGAF